MPGTLTATNGGAAAVAPENVDENPDQSSAPPESTLQVPAQILDRSLNSGPGLPPTLGTYLNFGKSLGGDF
jgi:hypothetical protein